MRTFLSSIAVLAAISLTPAPAEASILGLFGFDCSGEHNSGCGCRSQGGCGNCCEPACGCGGGCCEPACGCGGGCCEPTCGCGGGCYANGRQYAGQKYQCCCESRAPICPCVGCNGCGQGGGGCGTSCGCGDSCEPACGCGSSCEPSCGCGSSCGPAGSACCPHKCCLKNCGFCCGCGNVVNALCKCAPCSGCSSEIYWSEWHNDPPYCQDPCNCNGEWVGPSGGYNGGYGCNGGYVGQSGLVNNGAAYAQNAPANRMQVANNSRPQQPVNNFRPAYAGRPANQSAQVRTASRPTTNRAPSSNGNGAQTRPILW
jgi:hypothetical protein